MNGKNKYASEADLSNEASVEQFFVNRLLADLGYKDAQIKPKASLSELLVSRGRNTVKWRPDYALEVEGRVRWIVEAKAPTEDLDSWVGQAGSYCHELNSHYDDNPVEFFMLTNGTTTRVYRWDNHKFLVEADFVDFVDGNTRLEHIRELLLPANLNQAQVTTVDRHQLRRHTVEELNQDFTWAHRLIFRAEALSYTAAFMEFVKVIFLKLQSDRDAHNNPQFRQEDAETGSVPTEDVKFSVAWIEKMESASPSPLDQIHFANLTKDFEQRISDAKMKRIFESGEGLKLSANTIKALVRRFEHVDLISIDADLNGRMFETFLNAALRGKDLGQFFTPRSVVKLATRLADLKVTADHVDRVLDACCGTGGFLIEALADMGEKVKSLPLSDLQKGELSDRLKRDSIIGIDVARDPALARIARINMYLHGDPDSKIYQLDALDKQVSGADIDSTEITREKAEFRGLIKAGETKDSSGRPKGMVDVVLTNPPFAKEYNRREQNEARLLDDYVLATREVGGKREKLPKLSSMVMFLERYYDLLAPGGLLVTVLDDGILGAKKNAPVREWIRKNWLIKAVVSLPGDAFQRSQARVKTSILILEKKRDPQETQPDVFMYYCGHVGVDDSPRQRRLPVDIINRQKATDEIEAVANLYAAFKRGDAAAASWTVKAADLGDRLDVKANLIRPGEQVPAWKNAGLSVVTVDELLAPVPETRTFPASDGEGLGRYLRVRYDGFCEAGDEFAFDDVQPQRFTTVRTGDVVFSHINAVHGAVGVVPEELDGCVVTSEYSVCRTLTADEEPVVWTLLRSVQARADLIALATGIGRTRVSWTEIARLQLPWPDETLRESIRDAFRKANEAERRARALRLDAAATTALQLNLAPAKAQEVISAFKPPR